MYIPYFCKIFRIEIIRASDKVLYQMYFKMIDSKFELYFL